MKTLMTILFLFIAQLTFAQPPSNRVTDQSGNEQLLGELTTDDLSMSPFKKWYNKGGL